MRAAILLAALVLSGCFHDMEMDVSGKVELTGFEDVAAAIEKLSNSDIRLDVIVTVQSAQIEALFTEIAELKAQ